MWTQGLPPKEQGLRGLWLRSHREDQEAVQQQEAPAAQQKNPLGFLIISLTYSFHHQVFNRVTPCIFACGSTRGWSKGRDLRSWPRVGHLVTKVFVGSSPSSRTYSHSYDNWGWSWIQRVSTWKRKQGINNWNKSQDIKETAFRQGEVQLLRVVDIDFERGIINLNKPLKWSNPRQTKISNKLVVMITRQANGSVSSTPIWLLSYNTIHRTFFQKRKQRPFFTLGNL